MDLVLVNLYNMDASYSILTIQIQFSINFNEKLNFVHFTQPQRSYVLQNEIHGVHLHIDQIIGGVSEVCKNKKTTHAKACPWGSLGADCVLDFRF